MEVLRVCFFIFTCLILSSVAYAHDYQCGQEASPNPIHYSPWLVLLEFYRRGHLTEFRCGGTLVDDQHVITAAHCIRKVKHHRIVIRLGDYNLMTKVDCVDGVCADPYVRVGVARVYVHPEYDGRNHDIAIVRLKKKVTYSDFIRSICLPTAKLKTFAIFDATGWGQVIDTGIYSPTKKSILLPSWTYNDCRDVYKNYILPQNVICAGGLKGIDTCRGDSGGPLTYRRRFTELHGITSLGPTTCGSEGQPGIYTRVIDYIDWIHEILKGAT